MPTLIRLLVSVFVLAALGLGAMFVLANFVTPNRRDITVDIPVERLLH